MSLNLAQIVKITRGSLLKTGLSNDVHELAYDSRRITLPHRAAFFALRTAGRDGVDYIDAAYQAGVRTFVVHQDFFPDKRWYEGSFIAVADTLRALQAVAAAHRQQFNIPVIGITGSNGKTIVKDWLSWLLEPEYRICKSPKSYNSQLGVAVSLWELEVGDEMGIFEAGISEKGEMARLATMIQPEIGIFTHLGEAHAEHFVSPAEKLEEKFELFRSVKKLVVRVDDPLMQAAVRDLQAKNPGVEVLAWSQTPGLAPIQLLHFESKGGSTVLQLQHFNQQASLEIPFNDPASLENAMHCWVLLKQMGYSDEVLAPRFARLPHLEMRMEMKAALNGSTLINDSYSLDIDSLRLALQQLASLQQHPQRWVILSDFDRERRDEGDTYQRAAALLREAGVNKLFAVGPALKRHKKHFSVLEARFYETTEQLLADLPSQQLVNTALLLKGARKFGFERVERLLSLKMHQTVLEVDLDALLHNYRFYRGSIRPQTKMMVMVKAFSYGSGSVEIAALLQNQRADYLAVAFADEGVALREAGIRLPIMVMNVEPSSLEKLVQYRLEPEVYSFRLLDELESYLRHTREEEPLYLHINIDTGMKRLGFETSDMPELSKRLRQSSRLRVASVYSHLVASDAPEHNAFTKEQIKRFDEAYQQLAAGIGYRPLQHILNTAGIINHPEAQFDMVRLGIGLYGFDSSGHFQQRLQSVSTLKTLISQLHEVAPGETVGYNRNGKSVQQMRIATLPVGYADGIVRACGNGKVSFMVNGKLAPTVGNICMDMCMIDVTHIDCREGDPVIIFGRELPITTLAAAIGTIPYEVLTSVSQRVKRVYLKD